ncbi:MAG: rRNA cytosine-C5-methyltransferase, partial [Bacteroidaceae bacterium]|nr:rRNA cytosine-C5-methyltransferase [Bacteroidaceae bacterium]
RIASCVATLQVGIPLAAERGKKYIPEHTLALSTELSCDAFPIVELTLEQALSYLRRESILLPPEVPRGYVVVAFAGPRLGFVNNLGNRANNMYPNEWRIRH